MTHSVTALIDERLRKLGRVLPPTPAPAGAYRSVMIRNDIGCVSGQFPFVNGELLYRGRVGAEISEVDARKAAEIAALNALAQIRSALQGFDSLEGLLRLDGHVASVPGFVSQPRILDAASEFFVAVLGPDLGAHARTASSADQLPLGACVKLVVTFAVKRERH